MTNFRFGRNIKPQDRKPVAWYHPLVLLRTASDVLSSLNQFRNHDERESFALPMTVIDRSQCDGEDFWFDFIADTGDGGNATYAVARTALSDSVDTDDGQTLWRGELLLFGGDLAYPSASALEYRYRFVEMFEAALPGDNANGQTQSLVRGKPLTVAALPQNHDWMDSASTFGRYFIRNKQARQFLGADIAQKQSYFCVRLPQGWWVLGLDFAMTGDIDRDQFEQFAALLSLPGLPGLPGLPTTEDGLAGSFHIQPHDRVVLIYPVPVWTTAVADGVYPGGGLRYQRLEGLLGTRIALRLSGDLHHYMRWTSERDGQLVICGTGGAFSHPTHTRITTAPIVVQNIVNTDAIPAAPGGMVRIGLDDGQGAGRPFERVKGAEFPPMATSRKLALGNLIALFSGGDTIWEGNRWFAVMLGSLYCMGAFLNRLPLGAVLTLAMLGALCLALGWESLGEGSPKWPAWRCRLLTGTACLSHVLCHWLALGWLAQLFLALTGGMELLLGLGMFSAGALVGTLIFGTWLAAMSWFGWLTTNGYSALGLQDFKGLMRFKISPDGALHGYFIAIDKVPRQWDLGPNPQPVWEPADRPLKARVHDRFIINKPNTVNTP